MQLCDSAYIVWVSLLISCWINLPRGCYCRGKIGPTLLNNDGLGDFENMASGFSDRMWSSVDCGVVCEVWWLLFFFCHNEIVWQVLCEDVTSMKEHRKRSLWWRKHNTNNGFQIKFHMLVGQVSISPHPLYVSVLYDCAWTFRLLYSSYTLL